MERRDDLILFAVSALSFYRLVMIGGFFPVFVPLIITLVSYYTFKIFINENKRLFILSYAQMTGIILWYYIGILSTKFSSTYPDLKKIIVQINSISLIDVTILLILLIWLIIRPGLISAIASLIYSAVQVILSSIILSNTFDNAVINFQKSRRGLFIVTFAYLILGLAEYLKNRNKPTDRSLDVPSGISP